MISVIVYRICIHVSNAEDVDEHTEERCYEEEHDCNVIDVNSNAEDFLFDGHSICSNPAEVEPISDVI